MKANSVECSHLARQKIEKAGCLAICLQPSATFQCCAGSFCRQNLEPLGVEDTLKIVARKTNEKVSFFYIPKILVNLDENKDKDTTCGFPVGGSLEANWL